MKKSHLFLFFSSSDHKRILLFLSVFILIFLLLWYAVSRHDFLNLLKNQNKFQPNYFAYHLSNNYYDDNGKLLYRLTVKKAQYFEKDQMIWLDNPHFLIYNAQDELVAQGHSKTGKATLNNSLVHLFDHITITFSSQNEHNEHKIVTTFKTEDMTIDVKKHQINTDKSVTIIDKYGTFSAVGMNYDYKTGVLDLHSKVGGESSFFENKNPF